MIRLLVPVALILTGCGNVDGGMLGDTDKLMQVIYMLAFLALVMFGFGRSVPFGKTVKYLAIWLALLVALIYAYSFRDDLGIAYQRVKGELLPTVPQNTGDGTVTLRRNMDGHFSTRVMVNGTPATFMIDTGASSVVLPYGVADSLGYNPAELSFIVQVGTANGTAVAAPIRIESMAVGDIVVENVAALVVEQGKLSQPLLGMSFLNRLRGFEVAGNTMTLKR